MSRHVTFERTFFHVVNDATVDSLMLMPTSMRLFAATMRCADTTYTIHTRHDDEFAIVADATFTKMTTCLP